MQKFRGLSLAYWAFLIVAALLATVQAAGPLHRNESKTPRQVNVGVGFDLSLDYGTSAVVFPNGTYHTVAKIEGSRAYKSLMRELVKDAMDAYESDIPPCWSQQERESGWLSDAKRYLEQHPFPGPLRNWMPQKPTRQVALEGMLSALKGATEAYIGTTVHSAAHGLPMNPTCHHGKLLHKSLESLGLWSTDLQRQWISAYQAATYANGLTECPAAEKDEYGMCSQPPQRGLFIDYSRAALRMSLFVVDDSFTEDLLHRILPDLGANAIPAHHHADPHYWASVRKAIHDFATDNNIRNDTVAVVPDNVSRLVLGGELGLDGQLRAVLQDVLAGQVTPKGEGLLGTRSNKGWIFGEVIDPMFAVAVGTAAIGWDSRVNCARPPDRWCSLPDRAQANCIDE